jgi:hypothetical protein
MNYSLSDKDIIKLLKGRTKVVIYPELANYITIDDLVGKYGSAVILYINSKTGDYGHWCAVIKHADRIEFWDSYGIKPDREFDQIDENTRKQFNFPDKPYLSKLLLNSKYKIEYNHEQLQKYDDKIATCGRWVVLRILLKDIPLNRFIQMMKSVPNMTPDEVVTFLTNKI